MVPTLSASEFQSLVLDLLQNNGGCRLPCWWGIIPGKTSWPEAQKLLEPKGTLPGSYPIPDGSVLHDATFHIFDLHLFNELGLVEKKDIIETMHVTGEGLRNPKEYRKLWKKYAPEEIVRLYGSPSKILLQTWQYYLQPRDPTYKYYDLSLFYDQFGFIIHYKGRIENKPNYTVCPTFSGKLLEEISIFTRSPVSRVPLEDLMGEDGGPQESVYPMLEASDLTVQQFYNLITPNHESTCFNTKEDIWPK